MTRLAAARGGAALAAPAVVADEEALPFAAGSLDLVLSVLSLHWVNELPGTLLQIGRALKPDGVLLAAMIGGDRLRELRDARLRAELEVEDGVSPRGRSEEHTAEIQSLMHR